jgi:hypothetical protein
MAKTPKTGRKTDPKKASKKVAPKKLSKNTSKKASKKVAPKTGPKKASKKVTPKKALENKCLWKISTYISGDNPFRSKFSGVIRQVESCIMDIPKDTPNLTLLMVNIIIEIIDDDFIVTFQNLGIDYYTFKVTNYQKSNQYFSHIPKKYTNGHGGDTPMPCLILQMMNVCAYISTKIHEIIIQ